FSSTFSFLFNVSGPHNVTLVVNDSLSNDTFTFQVAVACADADGDGFNRSSVANCGVVDCNDDDYNILPPTGGYIVNRSTTFCPGIFNINNQLTLNVTNGIVSGNDTVINQTGASGFVRAFNDVNLTLRDLRIVSFFSSGLRIDTTANSTFLNINITSDETEQFCVSGGASCAGNTIVNLTADVGQISFGGFNNIITNSSIRTAGTDGISIAVGGSSLTISNTFTSGDGTGIYSESSAITLVNNNITGSFFGVFFSGSQDNVLINNTIGSGSINTFVADGTNYLLENNTIFGDVTLDTLSNSRLTRNLITQSIGIGISLSTVTNITINENTISDNTLAGIHVQFSSNNTISNNIITGNGNSGIHVTSSAIDNTFRNNTFSSNTPKDINSATGARNNTLILTSGNDVLAFYRKIINVTDIDNLYISTRIGAVNSSIEQPMNVSAEITLTGLSDPTTPTIYRSESFTTDPDAVVAGGIVCDESTFCQNITYNSGTLKFNVTQFSSYAVDVFTPPPSGGSGGGSHTIGTTGTPVFPTPSLPTPTQPVTEVPSSLLTTSITPEQVVLNPFACTEVASTEVAPELAIQSLENSAYNKNIKRGYDVLVSAFTVACDQDSFSVTLSLPDSFTNITALRCSGDVCTPVMVEERTTLSCGGKLFEDVTRKSLYLEPEFFPVPLEKVDLTQGEFELQSGRTKVSFIGELTGKVSLDKVFGPTPEAKNPRIKIVGTPSVLTFESGVQSAGVNITLPYELPEHVDELSIATYVLKDNQWSYIGGNINVDDKTVTTNIKDISDYIQNNQMTLAVMGLVCLNCYEGELDQVYDGGSRDAVILVHGFENTPDRFEDIINDIRLTQQPWQVWTYGYPSNKPIEENAKDLADLLQTHSKEYDFIYIAAHSLGGLVTQEALHYADTQNFGKNERPYPFVDKVVKVVSVATPNKGAVVQELEGVLNFLVNSDTAAGLFNLNSKVVDELVSGKEIPRVPGIEYLVIAGTQQYDISSLFGSSGVSDGLVSLESAQTVGGELVNNYCDNFWSINTTHTDILNNFDSRKIIERIVAKEIATSVADKPVIGNSQYYALNVVNCNKDDQYIIVGVPVIPEARPNPGLCSCGNSVCGLDEDELSCPTDCAVIQKPESSLLLTLLRLPIVRNILIGLLITSLLIILLSRRRHVPAQVLVATPSASEQIINDLIVKTRVAARTGDFNEAAALYNRLSSEYRQAPLEVRERFQSVYDQITDEMEKSLK
ncbi:MAG TPA: right-handed parallel beta-helix repeat-containing protein, partial [Candidatus Nanoarchaeia archaeon]|nr:right-handed parallel beta-helix repeat-containing protein [Candidatus Nanoarchaeia archaeon]